MGQEAIQEDGPDKPNCVSLCSGSSGRPFGFGEKGTMFMAAGF
jgi:hypothetical protein